MALERIGKSTSSPTLADVTLAQAPAALRVVRVDVAASEFDEHPNPQDKIAVVLRADGLDVAWHGAGGRSQQARVLPGTSSLMPRDMPYRTRWRAAGEMALVSFAPGFLVSREERLGVPFEMAPAWSRADPFLLELTRAVLRVHEAGLATALFLDAAAEVLATHLGARDAMPARIRPRAHELRADAVARALSHIDAHLGDDLSVEALARVAGYPAYGFVRAFRGQVGMPPHRYVMRRRCERAREAIALGAAPLAQVALDCGFASQAHMTLLFRRLWGITPGALRRS